jgi:aspartyl-tRNA synthetase
MAVVAGLNKVFEIGPVFRAENSNTGRHLCEFTGLDMEFVFNNHYFEVMDTMNEMFIHIFEGLNETCKKEIEVIND